VSAREAESFYYRAAGEMVHWEAKGRTRMGVAGRKINSLLRFLGAQVVAEERLFQCH